MRIKVIMQFKLLPNPVYLEPDEVYQPFVEIEENLTITKELYMTIVSHDYKDAVELHLRDFVLYDFKV